MAITWGTIKSLLLFFGPILLPKAIAYYRSIRAAPTIHGIPVRPIPPAVLRALIILGIVAFSFIIKILPICSPENIFSLTQSRLQIPTDVLFTRLSSLRPTGLTPSDEILRGKINSLESRLLLFQFGPDIITDCSFCSADDPNSYLYFALPSILAPHLFNLCVLALVTSSVFTGKEGGVWRTTATITAAAVAIIEVYLVASYHYQGNSRALKLENIDFFFWKMRVYRGLGIAVMDSALGYLLYLSSTNRAFLNAPSTAERIETSTRILEGARRKIGATGILMNTMNRDEGLRERQKEYWAHEVRVMGEMMEEREVVEGVRNALEGRINVAAISADAETYSQSVFMPMEMGNGTL